MIRTQLGKKISKEKKALCFFLFQTPLLSPLSLLSPSSLPPLSLLSPSSLFVTYQSIELRGSLFYQNSLWMRKGLTIRMNYILTAVVYAWVCWWVFVTPKKSGHFSINGGSFITVQSSVIKFHSPCRAIRCCLINSMSRPM